MVDAVVEGMVVTGLVVVVSSSVVVVVLSLQPNQPGVLQVEVDEVLVGVVVIIPDELVAIVVVVLSKQPHQPGVSQVSVRVRVILVVEDEDVVVLSVPLLSYIFQLAQSRHSGVRLHSGTVSYFMITSWMTDRIL